MIVLRVNIIVTDENGDTYEGMADLTKATTKSTKVKKVPKTNKSTAIMGPAAALKKLYYEHFFKTEKNIAEVMKKLSDEGINFSIQLISMALYRAKYLTKKGSVGSYTYVQKQPPG